MTQSTLASTNRVICAGAMVVSRSRGAVQGVLAKVRLASVARGAGNAGELVVSLSRNPARVARVGELSRDERV